MGRYSSAATAAAGGFLLVCAPASAAMGNVSFSGNVTATCTLTVTNASGAMTMSSNLQNISSRNAGGIPGQVTVTTTGGVTVSVDPVTVASQPAADVAPTTWTPTYSVSGSHVVAETSASSPLAAAGTGMINVNLTGTKSGLGNFVTGSYAATVTVRCEP